jgi:anti-sigma regulatory factor (Ser/Thr protein kinase)
MGRGSHISHEIDVPAGPGAAATARAALSRLGVPLMDGRLADAKLAISEVVTNAVTHGRLRDGIDTVRITVGDHGDRVRVTVEQVTAAEDVAMAQPRVDVPKPGGFGLNLLDQITDDWGYEAGPPGVVWFELHENA